MKIGYVSAIAGQPATTLDDIVAEVRGVESDGFAFYVVPSIFSLDAVGMLTVAGRETERIELIPAVVPTPPRHPAALAQQALTAQAASRGRFTLGIGLSHRAVPKARPFATDKQRGVAAVPTTGPKDRRRGRQVRSSAPPRSPESSRFQSSSVRGQHPHISTNRRGAIAVP